MKISEYLRKCVGLPERIFRLTETTFDYLAVLEDIRQKINGIWRWAEKQERDPIPCSIVIVGASEDGRTIVMGDRVFVPRQAVDAYSESVTKTFSPDYPVRAAAVIFLVASPEVSIIDVLIGNIAQVGAVGAVPFVVTRDPLRLGTVLRVSVRHQKSP